MKKSKRNSKKEMKSKKSTKAVVKASSPVELTVVCPKCGAWKDKPCTVRGKAQDDFHPDRTRLAKVQLSSDAKARLETITKADDPKPTAKSKLTPEQKAVVEILADKIEALGKQAEFIGPVSVGPIVSTYRFFPLRKTKVAHLESMAKDFAVALGVEDSIFVKRMPGESAVGITVQNKDRKIIQFRDTVSNVAEFMDVETKDGHKPIPLNFGIDVVGNPFVDDLTDQPHLLIAGTTGAGKSTIEHGLTLSMLWTMSPQELRMIISDTKGVEFKAFENIPHLQFPICTNVFKTAEAMAWCVEETQTRLDLIGKAGVRNIHEYNKLMSKSGGAKIPYVVFVIDELNDIIGSAVEAADAKANSARLGTIVGRSRASGIHVIAATQRPDVRLIKGSIKSNFSSRLSFRLLTHQDSRTVLSTKGAENLMSKGDMLYQSSTNPTLKRLHAPYTSLDDVKATIEFIVKREQQAHEERLADSRPPAGIEKYPYREQ